MSALTEQCLPQRKSFEQQFWRDPKPLHDGLWQSVVSGKAVVISLGYIMCILRLRNRSYRRHE